MLGRGLSHQFEFQLRRGTGIDACAADDARQVLHLRAAVAGEEDLADGVAVQARDAGELFLVPAALLD